MAKKQRRYLAPIVQRIVDLQARDDGALTDEEYVELHALQQQRKKERFDAVPKLTCCEQAKKFHAVYFSVSIYEPTPCWRVGENEYLRDYRQSVDPRWYDAPVPEVHFCPFCGTSVPMMRKKRRPPKDLCVVTDGGYYCDTCCERLQSCLCLPPAAAFEAVVRR